MTRGQTLAAIVSAAVCTALLVLQPFTSTQLLAAMKPSKLLVQPFAEPTVVLAAYDDTVGHAFSELLSNAKYSDLQQIAATITNTSLDDIDAMVVRWTLPKKGSATQFATLPLDRFARDGNEPLLRQGATMLVTPTGMILDEQVRTNFITSALRPTASIPPLLSATTVPIHIDSVVWHDGRVVGPDAFNIEAYLAARQRIARQIHSMLQTANADPRQIASTLDTMVSKANGTGPGSGAQFSVDLYFTRLLAAQARTDPKRIERLAIAELPRFKKVN